MKQYFRTFHSESELFRLVRRYGGVRAFIFGIYICFGPNSSPLSEKVQQTATIFTVDCELFIFLWRGNANPLYLFVILSIIRMSKSNIVWKPLTSDWFNDWAPKQGKRFVQGRILMVQWSCATCKWETRPLILQDVLDYCTTPTHVVYVRNIILSIYYVIIVCLWTIQFSCKGWDEQLVHRS